MKFALLIVSSALTLATIVQPSFQAKSECETKRQEALKLVEQAKSDGKDLVTGPTLVPNCNEDGTYATLQCHHNSNFCQCWDKNGSPLTQPKANLKKCSCLVDRAKALKSIPPSQTEAPEITSCEVDGSYQAKQCNRSACWCVNPETGTKLKVENTNKESVRC